MSVAACLPGSGGESPIGDLLALTDCRAAALGAGLDWKTSLQELVAAQGSSPPQYELAAEGPDHAKVFTATVIVDGEPRGAGSGRSKKEAEQEAAAQAWAALREAAGLDAVPSLG